MFSVSDNGYKYLEGYLKELYGERGSFDHNLMRYFNSAEHASTNHFIDDIDDISEVTLELLKYVAEREEQFKQNCEETIKEYDEYSVNGELSFDHTYELAGIMGLAPGQCDWCDTWFPHVCDLFFDSKEACEIEGRLLETSIRKKEKIIDVMVRVMLDGIRKGQIVNNAVDSRLIFSQGYTRNLWRGENAYYGVCTASMYRGRPIEEIEGFYHDLIATLKMMEFSLWINSLSFVKQWQYGSVYHGAVAQHYGIPTNAIDVSGDIKTAIFFACSKYDKSSGTFHKLQPEDYKKKDSRKNVSNLNGDSRYAILYKAPYDVINMSIAKGDPNLHYTSAFPIGYQPFMRCGNQNGYVIETGYPFDLLKDNCFSKFKFRLCPEIIDWIFEKMDGGYNVYPPEAFGSIDDIVNRINMSSTFSENALDLSLCHMKKEIKKNDVIKELSNRHIKIVPSVEWCTKERLDEIEEQYRSHQDELTAFWPEPKYRLAFQT